MSSDEGKRLAAYSKAVRDSTIKRLKLVESGEENWRINTSSMSIADIAKHLIDSDKYLFTKLNIRKLIPIVEMSRKGNIRNRNEYTSLINELEKLGKDKNKLFQTLNDAQLKEEVIDKRIKGKVTVWWIIVRGNLDHEAHHRGEIGVYLSKLHYKK